jgi:hypothetical protein
VGRALSPAPAPLVRLFKAHKAEADEGVGRSPGGLPHTGPMT